MPDTPMTVSEALARLRQYQDRPAPTWSTASYGGSAAEGTLAEIARTLAAEIEAMRERHKASLRRADEINNALMDEVQRYAEGTERPVLWSVYNAMHRRVEDLERERDKLIRWHGEDNAQLDAQRATITRLRAELSARPTRAAVLREEAVRMRAEADALPDAGQVHHKQVLYGGALVLEEQADEAERDGEPRMWHILGHDRCTCGSDDHTHDGGCPEYPTSLRWGLDDVALGDDDSVTLMLSGPDGEPYVLELEPERAAALRDVLGPEDETVRLRNRIAELEQAAPRLEWAVRLPDGTWEGNETHAVRVCAVAALNTARRLGRDATLMTRRVSAWQPANDEGGER